jgi:choline-phosphate cytidylyltransferase/glycerol-3-phosphate cytidylyltransferase
MPKDASSLYDIVYTSGTFDLFHKNHLVLLQRAKNLCNTLIVGVNTDELVKTYKNAPTIPFDERLAIVDALDLVDMAIPQNTLDHTTTMTKLSADCFVVGDDWYPKYDYLKGMGFDVIYLPYGVGVSSSSLKQEIAESFIDMVQKNATSSNPDPRPALANMNSATSNPALSKLA